VAACRLDPEAASALLESHGGRLRDAMDAASSVTGRAARRT
jgi:hypothetical protein